MVTRRKTFGQVGLCLAAGANFALAHHHARLRSADQGGWCTVTWAWSLLRFLFPGALTLFVHKEGETSTATAGNGSRPEKKSK